MKKVLVTLALPALLAMSAGVNARVLENYFSCSLADGKTIADVVALKNAYQAELDKTYPTYKVKVLIPTYVGSEMSDADVVWFGTFDSADLDSIMNWFPASGWPARFDNVLSCSTSSLWTVM